MSFVVAEFLRRAMRAAADRADADGVAGWGDPVAEIVAEVCGVARTVVSHDVVKRNARIMRLSALLADGRFGEIDAGDRPARLGMLAMIPRKPSLKLVDSDALGAVCGLSAEEAARRLADGLRKAQSPADAAAGAVPFLFEWDPPSAHRAVARVAAKGTTSLPQAEAANAPVFAKLATDDGGALDVRRIDDAFFRPVLAPGSWTPIKEAEFRAAVRLGGAFRDNPYRERTGRQACAMSVPEVARAEAPAKLAAEERAAADARLASAGPVVVVDGVVDRRTVEPTLAIVAVEDGNRPGRRWRLVWTFGAELAMTDAQDTVRLDGGAKARWANTPWWSYSDRFDADPPTAIRPDGMGYPLSGLRRAESVLAGAGALVAGLLDATAPHPVAEACDFGDDDPESTLAVFLMVATTSLDDGCSAALRGKVEAAKAAVGNGLGAAATAAAFEAVEAEFAHWNFRPTESQAFVAGLARAAAEALRAREAGLGEDQDLLSGMGGP
jgi:hypothetical protein